MKAWFIGIMFGGFFGFIVASMTFLLELTISGKDSKHPLLQAVQLIIIIAPKKQAPDHIAVHAMGLFNFSPDQVLATA